MQKFRLPSWSPHVLYFLPELEEAMDYSTAVLSDEIDLAKETCSDQLMEQPASEEFEELKWLTYHE